MRKHPIFGKCRLCHQHKRLVDSHIIPDFQFKPLKKKDGFFYRVSTDPKKKVIKQQKGITEHLLCATCDNERLQKNETHLSRVVFGIHSLDLSRVGRIVPVSGYVYKKVKNALLSILWRMSISSRPDFRDIDLGAKHEEAIRLALLNDTVFAEEQYPILLTAPLLQGQFYKDLIVGPDYARFGSNRVYRCLISGLVFTFIVGSAPLDGKAKPFILRQKTWPLVVAKVEEIPFLYDTFFKLSRAKGI